MQEGFLLPSAWVFGSALAEGSATEIRTTSSAMLSCCVAMLAVLAEAVGPPSDARGAQPLWSWPYYPQPRSLDSSMQRQCLPDLGNQLRRASEAGMAC